jgi:RNA polymerase sigma-70 factor (ECF subfamily)
MESTFTETASINLTEAEAISRAKTGDSTAFEVLYHRHCPHVYSLCLRTVKHPAEAENLTQQTFLQIFRKIGTFRGESGFSTWLHRVTVNVVLMHIRRKKIAQVVFDDSQTHSSLGDEPVERGSSDNSMLCATDRLNLSRAIRKLPFGYKRIFFLYDIFGYPHSEIARLLGCSIGRSKSQLHKARKRLRQLLQGKAVVPA